MEKEQIEKALKNPLRVKAELTLDEVIGLSILSWNDFGHIALDKKRAGETNQIQTILIDALEDLRIAGKNIGLVELIDILDEERNLEKVGGASHVVKLIQDGADCIK